MLSAIVSFVVSMFSKNEHDDIPAWIEPLVIFVILVLNATVGLWTDYDAEKALEKLKDL